MIVVLIWSVNIVIFRHSVRTYCVDHFGAKFERRSEDAGEQFVLSCQLRQLFDDFSQLHGQAANFSVKMRVQVVAPRNRLEVLLIAFGNLPPVLLKHGTEPWTFRERSESVRS